MNRRNAGLERIDDDSPAPVMTRCRGCGKRFYSILTERCLQCRLGQDTAPRREANPPPQCRTPRNRKATTNR